jgi:hypothetical protein
MSQVSLFTPVLATVLRDRRLACALSGAGALQLALGFFGLPGWQCPFFHGLGIPCPGCGLTRAGIFLFHGQWKQALAMHAFAPILLVGLAIITCSVVMPTHRVDRMAARIEVLETSTGITGVIVIGLIVYWLARLLIMQSAFAQLIRG